MATATSYTKAGVDAKAAPLSTAAPLAPGPASSGTSGSAARADHIHPPYPAPQNFTAPMSTGVTGQYRWVYPFGQGVGATAGTYKTLASVLPLGRKTTVTRFAVRVSVAADAGTLAMALYDIDPLTGAPVGAPLWSTNDISATAQGSVTAVLATPLTLDPGLYFLAAGGVGFTTTRPQLQTTSTAGIVAAYLAVQTGELIYPPAASLDGFDNATGTWPTLTGAYSEIQGSNNNTGTFAYAYTGFPVN